MFSDLFQLNYTSPAMKLRIFTVSYLIRRKEILNEVYLTQLHCDKTFYDHAEITDVRAIRVGMYLKTAILISNTRGKILN